MKASQLRQVEIASRGGVFDRSHQFCQGLSQAISIHPICGIDDFRFRRDDKHGIGIRLHRNTKRIIDRVGDPRNLRSEFFLGFGELQETLAHILGLDVAFTLGVAKALKDVIELNVFVRVVLRRGFQFRVRP